MSNTVLIKRSGTSSVTPTVLESGEIAINYADGKLFYKNSSNAIVGAKLITGINGTVNEISVSESSGSFTFSLPNSVYVNSLFVDGVEIDTTGATPNYVLAFNGTKFVPTQSGGSLATLSDVTISVPQTGEVLKYNGSEWINNLETGYNNSYATVIGDGIASEFFINHNFGTRDIFVQCRNNNSPYENIEVRWEATTDNQVKLDFSTVPSSSSIRVNIYASVGVVGPSAFSQNIGDGTNTDYVITHNLQTRDVLFVAKNANSPYEVVEVNWEATTANTLTAIFSTPPSSNSVRITVYAAAGASGVTHLSGTVNEVEVSGSTGSIQIGLPNNVTISGNLTVSGDLTINGNTTTVNTETLSIEDNIIVLNSNVTTSPTLNAGIEIERGTSSNVLLRWNETNDRWELTSDGSNYYNILDTSSSIDDISNVSVTSSTPGQFLKYDGSNWVNADIPTINTLDDVGDVVITSATPNQFLKWNGLNWINDAIDLGTDTNGNYMSGISAGTGIAVSHTPSEDSTATVSLNASLDNLTDVIVTSPLVEQSIVYNGTNWVNDYANLVILAHNSEATTLTVGTVVYVSGSTGINPSIKRATNIDGAAERVLGMVSTSIAAGANGPVIVSGIVTGLNLGSYLEGDILWLGTGGLFTKIEPTAPAHRVYLGVVVRANNGNGTAFIRPEINFGLEEIQDILISSATPGDFLKYNGTVWVNDQINLSTDTTGNYVQSLVAGTGVVLNNNSGEGATPTISIGQSVATTDNVIFNDVTVSGDLTVSGTTTTLNTTELLVEDNLIVLNTGSAATPSFNAGIEIERGNFANVQIRWNESTDKWQFTNDGSIYKDLGSGGVTVSDTIPSLPAQGDMWYESDTGALFAYYDSQWIEIGGSAAYNEIIGTIQAKGDLLAGSASQSLTRLGVGSNGTRLAADSTTATGLAWVSDVQNSIIDAKGDLLVGIADNTVARQAVGSSGQVLTANPLFASGVTWETPTTNRNLLINGGFIVDQRGKAASHTVTAGAALDYTVDRWYEYCTGANVTAARSVFTPTLGSPYNPYYQYQFTGAASNTLVGFGQRIEAINAVSASGGFVTLSALIWSSTSKVITWTAYYANTADTFGTLASPTRTQIATGTYTTTTSPLTSSFSTYFQVTANQANGIEIVFTCPSLTAGQTFSVANMQLERGLTATPFEQRPINIELAACQRYFWRHKPAPGAITYMSFMYSTQYRLVLPNPVEMRIDPNSVSVTAWAGGTTPSAFTASKHATNFYSASGLYYIDASTTVDISAEL